MMVLLLCAYVISSFGMCYMPTGNVKGTYENNVLFAFGIFLYLSSLQC